MTVDVGGQVRDARMLKGWTLRDLADRAGVALAVVHGIEAGDAASLESYARVATALGRRPSLTFTDARGRTAEPRARSDAEDFVHAAMGELEAGALAGPGRTLAIDEPYQHYQFAGRADVLAWDRENLLHIENRTRFPNVQEAAGAYNAKRQYLAGTLADRLGIGPRGWRSVTHVMACLWSAEVIHVLRLRSASFAALCPDPPAGLDAWLRGEQPPGGSTSTLVLLDPLVPFGSRRRTISVATGPSHLDPRYRDYADAATALRRAG
ncbi:MAG: helix-turn-helix transcriptional regulator [Candidatus Limnocylindrales bacterium]